ncbi:trypsin-like peptidase domain-containing protein [Paracidovorax avenae]|uniref:trypsin-like peptidase domain-containing protein n=1 Tax=Paracidovorax avenae TaxID=80867 RepID=UPI001314FE9F|nr:trypsin-like peptidase domain-containing protein [Paracidovorax avenae]
MYHGLNNDVLYSAKKITTSFVDDLGNVRHGSGTCFFIMHRGHMHLITNRHNLDLDYKEKALQRRYKVISVSISGKLKYDDQLPVVDCDFSLVPTIQFHPDPANDVASIYPVVPLGSNPQIDFWIPSEMLATHDEFQRKISVCDFVGFPGFPELHDSVASRPILRTGVISSDPRGSYAREDSVRGDAVAYEAFSYPGSSGSPIFALQKGFKPGLGIMFEGFQRCCLVGINAGRLNNLGDSSHSGMSYFYKSTAITDLIELVGQHK